MPARQKATNGRRASSPEPNARESLMSAARSLFTEKGYAATSVVEITQLAGISVGSLYYHFGGKQEIFLAIHEDYVRRQDQRVRDALHIVRAAGVTDPRRLFLVGTRAYLSGIWEDRDVSRVLADGETPSGFSSISRQWNDSWTRRNATLLSNGESEVATQAISTAVAGAVGAWARDIVACPDVDSAHAYIDQAIIFVGRVLGFADAEALTVGAS